MEGGQKNSRQIFAKQRRRRNGAGAKTNPASRRMKKKRERGLHSGGRLNPLQGRTCHTPSIMHKKREHGESPDEFKFVGKKRGDLQVKREGNKSFGSFP